MKWEKLKDLSTSIKIPDSMRIVGVEGAFSSTPFLSRISSSSFSFFSSSIFSLCSVNALSDFFLSSSSLSVFSFSSFSFCTWSLCFLSSLCFSISLFLLKSKSSLSLKSFSWWENLFRFWMNASPISMKFSSQDCCSRVILYEEGTKYFHMHAFNSQKVLMHDVFPFSTWNCLWCHHSHACPTNLEITCLRILYWLYLLKNGCTNFFVSHIQSMNESGPISSPKNGMSLWNVWCNSWLSCLWNLGLYVEYLLMMIECTYALG